MHNTDDDAPLNGQRDAHTGEGEGVDEVCGAVDRVTPGQGGGGIHTWEDHT